MNLSQQDLDLLAKNGDYEYEISLIGRKLTDEELKDKKNINLGDYGNSNFLFFQFSSNSKLNKNNFFYFSN